MDKIVGFGARIPTPEEEDRYLQFLLDEGLDLLSRFQKIPDQKKRRLVMEVVDALAGPEGGAGPDADIGAFRASAKLA